MNQHVASRLKGIHSVLCSAFEAGALLSPSSKGYERETFISLFLSEVFPPIYRFGTGDITDSLKNDDVTRKSGQIDIVIEMPWAPSFPTPVGSGARLYPSEAVGTAIEVKSDLSAQWGEVIRTATALEPLRQKLGGITVRGGSLGLKNETEEPVPFYAVGYKGWSTAAKVEEKVRNAPMDGILVLKHQIFAWSDRLAWLRRLTQFQDELGKKRRGESFDETQATCARILELSNTSDLPTDTVSVLNSEQLWVRPVHFGDEKFLPSVDAGSWTEETLQKVCTVFQLKTRVLVGVEAMLQFVNVVHQEVAKRAAMSVNLLDYAS
jgi:hypothetical protein